MPFRSRDEALHERERQLVTELDSLQRKSAQLEQELDALRREWADTQRTLDDLAIASPCTARWEQMQGDDRVRHCATCDKKVFNFEALTRREASELLALHGEPCVRLRRRRDGTVITGDCPEGVRLKRRRRLQAVGVLVTASAGLAVASSFTMMGGLAPGPHPRSPELSTRTALGALSRPAAIDDAALEKLQASFERNTVDVSRGEIPPNQGVATVDRRRIDRANLERLLLEPTLADHLRIRTEKRAGAKRLVLVDLPSDGVTYGLGFVRGDVLLALNGHPLVDPESVLEAYAGARQSTRWVFEIERAGKPHFLIYQIE